MTAESKTVAVVTGGAGLIGAAVCAKLSAKDIRVISIDRGDHSARNGDVTYLQADVSSVVQVADLVGKIDALAGRVDWLVHSAALTGDHSGVDIDGRIRDVDIEIWRRILDVNLTGSLIVTQQFLPLIERSRDPRIVLIGSIQGIIPTVDSGPYAASKAAMIGLTRQLAAELASDGIPINLVCPGTTTTSRLPGRTRRLTPMGPSVAAEEMGATIVALLSDFSPMTTGSIIPVDGGEHLRPRSDPGESGEV